MSPDFEPAYVKAHQDGRLGKKARAAYAMLRSCRLCPRKCKVNRLAGETGVCKTGRYAKVSSFNPHFGEEAPLVGSHGSGTVFFTHCNLLCLFCQNFDISHEGYGQEVSDEELAGMMLALQKLGCHNINFVTPSHVVPQILGAVEIAAQQGLSVPLIYNTGGYDQPQTLKLLEDVFDINMPDFKFWDPGISQQACNAADYPEVARTALKEMHRQVGDLVVDNAGIARRGLLIRHLVLPHGLAGTGEIMRFIAQELSADSYVNIMTQYRPCGRASEVKGLGGYPSRSDFEAAVEAARRQGITRLDRPRRVFMLH
jgi:putative pyruvate formate lyase activating enzyme